MILPEDRETNCAEAMGYYVACLNHYDPALAGSSLEELLEGCCELRNALVELANPDAAKVEGDEYAACMEAFETDVVAAAERVRNRMAHLDSLASEANSAIAAGREPPDAPDQLEVVLTLGQLRAWATLVKRASREIGRKNYRAARQDLLGLQHELEAKDQ